ncbi:unnamed protein product [Rhizophagus irregularis]|nr:unnamed protein product [Rhizophagus irregularis]CAB5387714.1 unnamed protein product [Rhizophagus irregularis]
MGLFYQMSPRTDKLKPWVIGNAKRLRPLLKVNLECLPVFYHKNKKAWMNSVIFKEVLCEMDNYFRAKNKKILLLVDNASSHFNLNCSSAEQDEQDEQDEDDNTNDEEIETTASRGHGGGSRGGTRGRDKSKSRSSRSKGRGGGSKGRSSKSSDESNRYQPLTHIEVAFLPPNTTNDPAAALLADELYDFFHDLEEIPTEEILSDDNIIRLIQNQENENDENDSDSEEEQILVPSNDALKSLQTWITFFKQQKIDEFSIKDMKIFEKYFKIVKQLEHQFQKQVSITDFF